jgi:hypothetical protein
MSTFIVFFRLASQHHEKDLMRFCVEYSELPRRLPCICVSSSIPPKKKNRKKKGVRILTPKSAHLGTLFPTVLFRFVFVVIFFVLSDSHFVRVWGLGFDARCLLHALQEEQQQETAESITRHGPFFPVCGSAFR